MWLIKENSLLKKEVEKLNKEIEAISSSSVDKDKRIKELRVNLDKECSQRYKAEADLGKLKEEAVNFYKNDLLINSMKIIMKILKEEKPSDVLIEQRLLAQANLDRMQGMVGSFNQGGNFWFRDLT